MATHTDPIVLYDFKQNKGEITWSPNVFKTKLLLHYKRLPYRSIFIRGVEIHPTLKGLGFKPTWYYRGDPVWTVPAIIDPSSAIPIEQTTAPPNLVIESRKIAHHLDDAYPNTPRAFPHKDDPLYETHEELLRYFTRNVVPALIHILTPGQWQVVDTECAARMERRFSPLFFQDQKLNDVFRKPEEREEIWGRLKASLDEMARLMDAVGFQSRDHRTNEKRRGRGPYTFGRRPYFVDIVMVANFLWAQAVPCDRDAGISHVWDVIGQRNGGRWAHLVDTFEGDFGTQWQSSMVVKEDGSLPRTMEIGFAEARL